MRLLRVIPFVLLVACGGESYTAHPSAAWKNNDLGQINRASLQVPQPHVYLYQLPNERILPNAAPSPTQAPVQIVDKEPNKSISTDSSPKALIPTAPAPPSVPRVSPFMLEDLTGKKRSFGFPVEKPTLFALADREGAGQMDAWMLPLSQRYAGQIEIHGIAELSIVPAFARGIARTIISGLVSQPILLDWTGDISQKLGAQKAKTVLVLINPQGEITHRETGAFSEEGFAALSTEIEKLISP